MGDTHKHQNHAMASDYRKYKVTALISSIICLLFTALMIFIALQVTYNDTDYRPMEGILHLFENPSFISACTFFGGAMVLLVIAFDCSVVIHFTLPIPTLLF